MSYYLSISPQQEPFDVGPDDAGRALYSFNVIAWKRPGAEFALEILAILEGAGVGVGGVNMFGSSQAVVPVGDGPFIVVRATGGPGPVGTHNDGAGAYRRPSAQVLVHASDAESAESTAQAALEALLAVRNRTVAAIEEQS